MKILNQCILVISFLITLSFFQISASFALTISEDDFTKKASFESFEGLIAGENIPQYYNTGYLSIGLSYPYNFESGVVLSQPVPNPADLVNGNLAMLICDFRLGATNFGLGSNGMISSDDVPFGTAYLAMNKANEIGPIEFTFQDDMFRVGAYVDGEDADDSNKLTMKAYDIHGNLLEEASTSFVSVDQWGSNFLGIENLNGIRKVTFSNDGSLAALVLDGLRFEGKNHAGHSPVPEPSTILLFGTGIAGLAAVGRKKRK